MDVDRVTDFGAYLKNVNDIPHINQIITEVNDINIHNWIRNHRYIRYCGYFRIRLRNKFWCISPVLPSILTIIKLQNHGGALSRLSWANISVGSTIRRKRAFHPSLCRYRRKILRLYIWYLPGLRCHQIALQLRSIEKGKRFSLRNQPVH